MKLIAPDYYHSFSCIAGKCRNSCCIGWEIDIDENTAEYYKSLSGELGKRLKNAISEDPSGSSFILSEGEQCPFLNSDGLCDIILQLGEDSLCQICSDHPRFRNYCSDRTEIGLGLCCEAAAHLILTRKEKTKLTVLCDDECEEDFSQADTAMLEMREKLINTAQNRKTGILSRIGAILSLFGSDSSAAFVPVSQMLSLERLNASWTKRLFKLKEFEEENRIHDPSAYSQVFDRYSEVFEQFLVYLLYRHFPHTAGSGKEKEILAFIASSVILPARIFRAFYPVSFSGSTEELIDIIREWSSEIEYSDENIDQLLSFFERNKIS